MSSSYIKKNFLLGLSYVFLTILFYYVAGEEIHYKTVSSEMPVAESVIDPVSENILVQQSFTVRGDRIDQISLFMATYGRKMKGDMILSLVNADTGSVLSTTEINVAELKDNSKLVWNFEKPVENLTATEYLLRIRTNCSPDEAPTIYYSENVRDHDLLVINGVAIENKALCISYVGKEKLLFGEMYWYGAAAVGVLIFLYFIWVYVRQRKGEVTLGLYVWETWKRYNFLIKQLVSRDFKTKYKRSVLGYLWSFLNPLLTMGVQYIVFSTIFRSDIKNFPVYLLSGIIFFGFFQEAVSQGLMAIVGNSALITKVYVPKYIYPLTKVVSSSINLLISIFPLLIVTILTGTRITKAVLLLPYVIVCLLIFCVGMSFMLSSCMVFFRDTQYLWGIFSLVWMYATPLFYPENIIPAQFKIIQQINPLYYFIKFARVILIEGVSPEPLQYFLCLVSALFVLVLGTLIFRKTQNKFILYI